MSYIIDDADPSIQYSEGQWNKGGVSVEYDSTTHAARGGLGSANLSFWGSRIEVYGTIAWDEAPSPSSVYTVDDGQSTTFTPATTPTNLYQQLFFKSPELRQDQVHTLFIESIVDGSAFYLDFFIVTAGSSSLTSSDNTPSSMSTSTRSVSSFSSNISSWILTEIGSGPLTTGSLLIASESLSTEVPQQSALHSPPKAARVLSGPQITGTVIAAAFLFICAITGTLYYYMRLRKHRAGDLIPYDTGGTHSTRRRKKDHSARDPPPYEEAEFGCTSRT
ncbi:hypothetical protein C8J56DRAFT_383340 [Mycena floridula]|nr:hypothetical protein C8J56DRAFT_383340 [Mycena floridula]